MPITTAPSGHFDPNTRDALIHAALMRDHATIDAITDRLAEQGVCRPRSDMSRMAEWIARRGPEIAAAFPHTEAIITAAGETNIGAQLAAHFRGVFVGAGQ